MADTTENSQPACADGVDNDGDGKIDLADPGCDSAADRTEADPTGTPPQCSDKKDNDSDGKIDYPADKGCEAAGDNDERDCDPVAYKCDEKAKIGGPNSAGRITVSKDGSFKLPRNIITCPESGGACAVKTSASARIRTSAKASASAKKKKKLTTKTVSLGGGTYTIKRKTAQAATVNRGAVRGKLTKKGLRLLKQRKAIRSTVNVRVVWEGVTTTRKISVIFKAPKKSKKKSKR
jgi:hypothetical protein